VQQAARAPGRQRFLPRRQRFAKRAARSFAIRQKIGCLRRRHLDQQGAIAPEVEHAEGSGNRRKHDSTYVDSQTREGSRY